MATPSLTSRLVRLRDGLRRTLWHARTAPLEWIQWLPGQAAWLACTAKRKLLRGGNQMIGKTTAGCGELIYRAKGDHPFRPDLGPLPPGTVLPMVCFSWGQSVVIQKKFWDLVDKRDLMPGTHFDGKNGFGAKHPTVRFSNGVIVKFLTSNQGGGALASGTYPYIGIDEPPDSQRVYGELLGRVRKSGGTLGLTLTPVNGPVDYLQEHVSGGRITEIHVTLSVQACTPIGAREPLRLEETGELITEEMIEEMRAEAGIEAPVVVDGEWETREKKRELHTFDERVNVVPPSMQLGKGRKQHLRLGWPLPFVQPKDRHLHWSPIGIGLTSDHGELAHHSVWLALAFQVLPQRRGRPDAHIRAIGEYFNPAGTDERDHVMALDELLLQRGIDWDEVDFAVGDHNVVGNSRGAQRVNDVYTALFDELLEVDLEVRKASKGAHSIRSQVRTMNRLFKRVRLEITEDCPRLIECVKRWVHKGPDRNDEKYKHAIDAFRYGVAEVLRLAEGELVIEAA